MDDGPGTGFDPGPGTPGEPPKAASARLSKEEFYGTFKFMFAVPNMVPVAPFPLKALPIQPGEEDQARAASDVIYDIAAETPHLRWLIEPGSEWMQRLLVIGTFAMGKGMAVMAELNARQAPRPEPAPRADAPKETPKEKPAHGDATTVTKIAA